MMYRRPKRICKDTSVCQTTLKNLNILSNPLPLVFVALSPCHQPHSNLRTSADAQLDMKMKHMKTKTQSMYSFQSNNVLFPDYEDISRLDTSKVYRPELEGQHHRLRTECPNIRTESQPDIPRAQYLLAGFHSFSPPKENLWPGELSTVNPMREIQKQQTIWICSFLQ